MRLEPPPRLVDASILGAAIIAATTGVYSAFAGQPGEAWIFLAHDVTGFVLAVLLVWKLRRVYRRLHPS